MSDKLTPAYREKVDKIFQIVVKQIRLCTTMATSVIGTSITFQFH